MLRRDTRHTLKTGTLGISQTKFEALDFAFKCINGAEYTKREDVSPLSAWGEDDIYMNKPEIKIDNKTCIAIFTDIEHHRRSIVEMAYKPPVASDQTLAERVTALEAELKQERGRTDAVIKAVMFEFIDEETDGSEGLVRRLLDQLPGKNLSDFTADISSSLRWESNVFERFVEQGYDLRNMCEVECELTELIDRGWFEERTKIYDSALARAILFAEIDQSRIDPGINWNVILNKFNRRYGKKPGRAASQLESTLPEVITARNAFKDRFIAAVQKRVASDKSRNVGLYSEPDDDSE